MKEWLDRWYNSVIYLIVRSTVVILDPINISYPEMDSFFIGLGRKIKGLIEYIKEYRRVDEKHCNIW